MKLNCLKCGKVVCECSGCHKDFDNNSIVYCFGKGDKHFCSPECVIEYFNTCIDEVEEALKYLDAKRTKVVVKDE